MIVFPGPHAHRTSMRSENSGASNEPARTQSVPFGTKGRQPMAFVGLPSTTSARKARSGFGTGEAATYQPGDSSTMTWGLGVYARALIERNKENAAGRKRPNQAASASGDLENPDAAIRVRIVVVDGWRPTPRPTRLQGELEPRLLLLVSPLSLFPLPNLLDDERRKHRHLLVCRACGWMRPPVYRRVTRWPRPLGHS